MAINVMQWVWEQSRSTLAARLVLLAIADNANSDGSEAWPSVAEIAQKANVGRATVTDSIRKLVELGELEVYRNQGKAGPNGVTNYYRVIMLDYPKDVTRRNRRRPPTPPKSGGVQDSDPSEFRTPAESAPVRDSDPSEIPADGVRIPGATRPNPGLVTVHEPPLTVQPLSGPGSGLFGDDELGAGAGSPAADAAADSENTTPRYPETAQGLVAWWIDHAKARPPKAVVGQVSRLVLGLLTDDEIPFATVRSGLWIWHESGQHPATLPSTVNAVLQGTLSSTRRDRPRGAGQSVTIAPPESEQEMVL